MSASNVRNAATVARAAPTGSTRKPTPMTMRPRGNQLPNQYTMLVDQEMKKPEGPDKIKESGENGYSVDDETRQPFAKRRKERGAQHRRGYRKCGRGGHRSSTHHFQIIGGKGSGLFVHLDYHREQQRDDCCFNDDIGQHQRLNHGINGDNARGDIRKNGSDAVPAESDGKQ